MTTALITTRQTPDQLNQITKKHPEIDYLFFYGNAADSITQKHWNPNQTINICRTALLRRNLIKEDQTPETPWQLCSLYDFYTQLTNSKSLFIINEQGETQQNKKSNTTKLLFILDKAKQQAYPEELIELIIAASLNFEVHVFLKDKTLKETHPWDKHLSALSHYDIKIDEQLNQDNASYIIDCY